MNEICLLDPFPDIPRLYIYILRKIWKGDLHSPIRFTTASTAPSFLFPSLLNLFSFLSFSESLHRQKKNTTCFKRAPLGTWRKQSHCLGISGERMQKPFSLLIHTVNIKSGDVRKRIQKANFIHRSDSLLPSRLPLFSFFLS